MQTCNCPVWLEISSLDLLSYSPLFHSFLFSGILEMHEKKQVQLCSEIRGILCMVTKEHISHSPTFCDEDIS